MLRPSATIGATPTTAANYEEWLEDPVAMMPDLWQIAWDGDEVAGQVRSLVNHKENAEDGASAEATLRTSVSVGHGSGAAWRRR